MPFTPIHAIVALPFARTPLPAGAVAVGAMAPDLPLFFPWVGSYELTHGFPGVLWLSLPVGTRALRDLASRDPTGRVGAAASGGAEGADAVGLGSRTAARSIRDLFTHPDRLGSAWVPALGEKWGPLVGTSWLQYGSSVVGLAGLAAWAVLAYRRAGLVHRSVPTPVAVVRLVAWSAAVAMLVGSFAVRVGLDGIPTTSQQLRDAAFGAGTLAGAAILVIGLLASILVRHLRNRPPENGRHDSHTADRRG